jgi:cytochrome P450
MLLLNPLQQKPRDHLGFPVLPGAFPVVGHTPAVALDLAGLLRHGEQRLGPFFWIDLGYGTPELICMHLDVFEAFKNKSTSSDWYRTRFPGHFFGEALLLHDGQTHQTMRSAMNPPFSAKGLSSTGVGELLASRVERRVRRFARGRGVRILAEVRELTLELIFAMIGVAETELAQWRKSYERLLLTFVPITSELPGLPHWHARRARAWLDRRLQGIIDAARSGAARGLVAELVRSKDAGDLAMSDEQLVDNLRLLVFAGHETTASTMAWIIGELAQRPEVWRTLCEEASGKELPRSPRDLKSFPYAEAVFRETLRLHPSVVIQGRRVTEDFEIAGRVVPRGAVITVPIIHLTRHPDLYERPDELVPERWLGRSGAPSPLELVPFGGGPHFCLGYHIAWMECVQLAVALVRTLAPAGLRPTLDGPPPKVRYYPFPHPSPGTRLRFDRA